MRLTGLPFWLLVLLALLWSVAPTQAQELEPRRWSQLPVGINFLSVAANWTEGDIYLDPLLELEDGTFEAGGMALGYAHSFGFFGQSARVDVILPYANGRWEGTVSGEYRSVRRDGLSDPRIRFSTLLYGGPAETPVEFARSPKSATVVGAALMVALPYGEYFEDKLINLGSNRWTLRPELGITHTHGKWTGEVTGSVYLYGDNDEFFGDRLLETDPLWALQAHLIYTFRPGLWASASSGYGTEGASNIDGLPAQNKVGNLLTSLAVGVPISRAQGVKVAWIRTDTKEATGSDSDSLLLAFSQMF